MKRLSASLLLALTCLFWLSPDTHAENKTLVHGLYVFQHVCMDCHGMTQARYSDMAALGVSLSSLEEWAKSRHASLGDQINSPFPTPEAAKASFGGDVPPDMSLLARQLAGGKDYIDAMLKSYSPVPAGYKLAPLSYYNPVALTHHHVFRMPSPFLTDTLTYPDGTKADIPQMAHDVSHFLEWASTPQTGHRTFYGIITVIYLFIMLGLLLALKRTIWK